MKHKLHFRFEAAVFAFILSFCAAACPVTAFPLHADLLRIALVLGLFSLLCGFSFSLRHGTLIPLGAMTLAAVWLRHDILTQTESLLLALTKRYAMAYNTPVLCVWAENGAAGAVDLPLLALGILVAFSVGLTLARRLSMVYFLIPLSLMPLSCIVVTDTVPHPAVIFGLFAAVSLLILTAWSRQHGTDSRLAKFLTLPVLLALGCLFLLVPEESYVNHFSEYQEKIMTWADQVFRYGEELGNRLDTSEEPGTAKTLNLQSLGPRIRWDYPMMDVTSPISGTLYLRGQDYDGYTGTGWTASRHRSEVFSSPGTVLGELTVSTRSTQSVRYVPYYPAEEITLASGKLTNDGEKTYTYTLAEPIYSFQVSADIDNLLSSAYSPWSDPGTWYLSESTLEWAEPLARSAAEGCTVTTEAAQAIADFVRASAVYDLDTPRMDGSERDFARWFLEESDTGYCVHFATAATVLLRALDIPARYVEGYMVQAEAGQRVTVSSRDAHAWAEYYCDGRWQVLEATPEDPEEDVPTEVTTPVETESAPPTRPNRQEETHPEEPQPEPGIQPEEPTQQQEKPGFTIPGFVRRIIPAALAVLAIWGQSEIRLRRKNRIWHRGRPNERALSRYRQLVFLSRLATLPIPEELEALTQKARFSQHTLKKEELQAFDAFRQLCMEQLRTQPLLRRLVLRLVFAVG